jgi:mannosyl-oligosaccharide alpha-1,2-mannosidase
VDDVVDGEATARRYRLTGDKKWQDKGWRMFTSWIDSCTAGSGLSSVSDVNAFPARLADNMVSSIR